MNEVKGMTKMMAQTKLGVLTCERSADPEYPGLFISWNERQLVLVDADGPQDGAMTVRVWQEEGMDPIATVAVLPEAPEISGPLAESEVWPDDGGYEDADHRAIGRYWVDPVLAAALHADPDTIAALTGTKLGWEGGPDGELHDAVLEAVRGFNLLAKAQRDAFGEDGKHFEEPVISRLAGQVYRIIRCFLFG
jgi:hypothetical protein